MCPHARVMSRREISAVFSRGAIGSVVCTTREMENDAAFNYVCYVKRYVTCAYA